MGPTGGHHLSVVIMNAKLTNTSTTTSLNRVKFEMFGFYVRSSPHHTRSVTTRNNVGTTGGCRGSNSSMCHLFCSAVGNNSCHTHRTGICHLTRISGTVVSRYMTRNIPFTHSCNNALSGHSFNNTRMSHAFCTHNRAKRRLLLNTCSTLDHRMRGNAIGLFAHCRVLSLIVVSKHTHNVVTHGLMANRVRHFTTRTMMVNANNCKGTFFLSAGTVNSGNSMTVRYCGGNTCFTGPYFTRVRPAYVPMRNSGRSGLALVSRSLHGSKHV